jgi:hypothetical protein
LKFQGERGIKITRKIDENRGGVDVWREVRGFPKEDFLEMRVERIVLMHGPIVMVFPLPAGVNYRKWAVLYSI